MDEDEKTIDEMPTVMLDRAKDLLLESGNCAQTSFAILNEEHNLDGQQILKALTPFPGIALRGETCGAVIGSLMALGLVYGREDMSDWKGYILQEKLGRNYDLADQVQALEYASSGGPEACSEVVASAVEIASEGIAKRRKRAE
jgi:C_GCAxxG_C_C family probable redox protein